MHHSIFKPASLCNQLGVTTTWWLTMQANELNLSRVKFLFTTIGKMNCVSCNNIFCFTLSRIYRAGDPIRSNVHCKLCTLIIIGHLCQTLIKSSSPGDRQSIRDMKLPTPKSCLNVLEIDKRYED